MKILLVNWRDMENPEAGGAEVHLQEIFSRIAGKGHQVTLVAHHFDNMPREQDMDGIRVLRTGRKFDFNYRARPFCRHLAAREDFDVVIEDLNKLPFFLSSAVKQPVCVILHHFFGDSIWRETNPLFASYVGLGEFIVKRTYKALPFCVVSRSTADELIAAGFDANHIEIIHNAVDETIYTPSEAVSKVRGRIIYLGRVKKYKGIDMILQALVDIRKTIPEAHLVIVGWGDDRARLESITSRLGLTDAVRFSGMVSTEQKVQELREAEVMVTPSPKEGWGVTTIEANACGTPVVASRVPGLRDAVRDGETGLLFTYGDIPMIVDHVRRVLTDAPLRERLTRNALVWASRFRWDVSAEDTIKWLEGVIAEGPHR